MSLPVNKFEGGGRKETGFIKSPVSYSSSMLANRAVSRIDGMKILSI